MQKGNVPETCVLRVYLLGAFEVFARQDDGSWRALQGEDWGKGRTRSVLKRLLLAPGRQLTRVTLAEDLWPESGDNPLHSAMNYLRKAIGKDLIQTIGTMYSVADQSAIWVDSEECSRLVKVAEDQGPTTLSTLPLLEQAVSLLERGSFLDGEGDHWCHPPRRRVEDMGRQCRFWLAESYENQGKLWQAGEQYRTLLQTLPPDEDALRAWMTMLHRHGQMQDALKHFHDAKTLWIDQGFSLSSLTEQLAEALSQKKEKPDNMDPLRRQLTFTLAAAFPALSTTALSKRLLLALAQQPAPDLGTVQYLQQRVEHYWDQRQAAKLGAVLVPYVTEDLQRTITFLEAPLLADMRPQLALIAACQRIIVWLAAIEAEIYATMGNQDACLAALHDASRYHSLAEQGTFYWLHFDASLLAGYEGACFLKLGKPEDARKALITAISTLDATTNRRKPRLLVDLADSYTQQTEIEEACTVLHQAVNLLSEIHSPVTLKRLCSLRQKLHPWEQTASVQMLDVSLNQLLESKGSM